MLMSEIEIVLHEEKFRNSTNLKIRDVIESLPISMDRHT
jgi:hypothetical protein